MMPNASLLPVNKAPCYWSRVVDRMVDRMGDRMGDQSMVVARAQNDGGL